MSLKKLLLMLPLLMVLGTAACDNDNESNAAAPPPGAEDASCPCFNENDVVDMGDAASDIECGYAIFGIALLFDMSGSSSLTAICRTDGTGCMCSNGDSDSMNLTQQEFGVCMNNLISGIAQFNTESVKLVGCVFD